MDKEDVETIRAWVDATIENHTWHTWGCASWSEGQYCCLELDSFWEAFKEAVSAM